MDPYSAAIENLTRRATATHQHLATSVVVPFGVILYLGCSSAPAFSFLLLFEFRSPLQAIRPSTHSNKNHRSRWILSWDSVLSPSQRQILVISNSLSTILAASLPPGELETATGVTRRCQVAAN